MTMLHENSFSSEDESMLFEGSTMIFNDFNNRLFEFISVPILILKDTKIYYANNEAIKLLKGKSIESVKGISIYNIIHSDYHDILEIRTKNYESLLNHKGKNKIKFYTLNNYIQSGELYFIPIESDIENVECMVLRDTTESERLKMRLLELEKISSIFLHTSFDGILILDKSGEIVHSNSRLEEMFMIDSSKLIGTSFINLAGMEDRYKLFESLEIAKEEKFSQQEVTFNRFGWTPFKAKVRISFDVIDDSSQELYIVVIQEKG